LKVTEQQWRVLRILQSHGAMEPTALAERCFLLPPSLTRILRDLERHGWVGRRRAARDGRRQIIALTRRGQRFLEDGAAGMEARYRSITAMLGRDKLTRLFRLLDELDAALAHSHDHSP
jgi:homoprotocatechuate degradation regulator HpaR